MIYTKGKRCFIGIVSALNMLVQFTLKNVLSFREKTTLDLTAVDAYEEHECNLIDTGFDEKLLKVAAVYGANASGKSNLYLSMAFFQNIVVESMNNKAKETESTLKKFYIPFSFDEGEKENSEFQIIFVHDHFEYRYGFEYNEKCIVTEWLYKTNLSTKEDIVIYERTTEKAEFGPDFTKECDAYGEQIPTDVLLLSFFNRLKLKTSEFRTVYTEIMSILVVPTEFFESEYRLKRTLPSVLDQSQRKEELMEFLTAIDTGIQNIQYTKTKHKDNKDDIDFLTFHNGRNGEKYSLNLFDESQGTIKSIMLFIYARLAIRNGGILFIDELNEKLHPLLLKFIVDLFYDEKSHAQLIYTTHDTTLLDKKFFRRDQIWFIQKDRFGYSELTALSDFKVRSDSSFESDYLAGVYGGIPFLREYKLRK